MALGGLRKILAVRNTSRPHWTLQQPLPKPKREQGVTEAASLLVDCSLPPPFALPQNGPYSLEDKVEVSPALKGESHLVLGTTNVLQETVHVGLQHVRHWGSQAPEGVSTQHPELEIR